MLHLKVRIVSFKLIRALLTTGLQKICNHHIWNTWHSFANCIQLSIILSAFKINVFLFS